MTPDSLPANVTIGSSRGSGGRQLILVMKSISIKHGRGRPREKPRTLYADAKYGMPLNRSYLDKKHIRAQIPEV